MPSDCNERRLTEIFGRFGEIIAITHKGTFAFVEFVEPSMADDAVNEMTNSGSSMRVQLAFAKGGVT